MMNQRSSKEKQKNKWHQIASSSSNQSTKFVGFTLQTCDFAPVTRWRRELGQGVFTFICFNRIFKQVWMWMIWKENYSCTCDCRFSFLSLSARASNTYKSTKKTTYYRPIRQRGRRWKPTWLFLRWGNRGHCWR